MKKLPDDAVTTALSTPSWRDSRARRDETYRWHVSDVVNTSPERRFCPREKVLQHFDTNPPPPSKTSPGFQLLFDVGNFYHDSIRDAFIMSEPYGGFSYGDWKCVNCGDMQYGKIYSDAVTQKGCKCECSIAYEEIGIYDKDHRVIGHPDFLVFYEGVFYLYEIKTIDRADIDFRELSAPLGDHALQGSTYYYIMKKLKYPVSRFIRFIYVDRSTSTLFARSNIKEFKVDRQSYTRLTAFMTEASVANRGIESRRLPARICKTFLDQRAKKCSCVTDCFARKLKNV